MHIDAGWTGRKRVRFLSEAGAVVRSDSEGMGRFPNGINSWEMKGVS